MSSKKPVRISVILSTYNSEKTLQRALDSIFSQEGINQDFEVEIIVIDDCSTDGTTEILRHNRIDYLTTNENSGGPNKGRNIGLSKATGEFICIMDHDDQWLPSRLKMQLSVSHLAPIITSGYTIFFQLKNKTIERTNHPLDDTGLILYEKNATFLQILSRSTQGQSRYIGSFMFHRSLKQHRFEEHFGKMDFDWGLRLFEGNCSVEICKSLYVRFVEDSNLSLNAGYRTIDFYYSLMTLDNYQEKYPKQVRLCKKQLHGSQARYFYLTGRMKRARYHFLRSGWNFKSVIYYLTTFAGANYVKERFTVFG